jgi:hypothetical protein
MVTMIDYDERRFCVAGHGPNAEAPVALYRQSSNLLRSSPAARYAVVPSPAFVATTT